MVAAHVPDGEAFAVKMDVQGYEPVVLDGGESAVRRAAILELEIALVPSYDDEIEAPELLARIFGYGFRLALVENVMQTPDAGAAAINGIFTRQSGV